MLNNFICILAYNSKKFHWLLIFFFCSFPPFDQNPAISGVVLEDFDSVFVNKFYHSHLDDLCELLNVLGIIFFFLLDLSIIAASFVTCILIFVRLMQQM